MIVKPLPLLSLLLLLAFWSQTLPLIPSHVMCALDVSSLDVPVPSCLHPRATLSQELEPPPIADPRSALERRPRNWPQQPPVIPHSIRGIQVTKNVNQCLGCHSRTATHISGAPMVSITHFTDRDGQDLAAVSPRRYFCVKCHVPQANTRPAKISTFQSIDQVLEQAIQLGE